MNHELLPQRQQQQPLHLPVFPQDAIEVLSVPVHPTHAIQLIVQTSDCDPNKERRNWVMHPCYATLPFRYAVQHVSF
jgi:hypothetical protein